MPSASNAQRLLALDEGVAPVLVCVDLQRGHCDEQGATGWMGAVRNAARLLGLWRDRDWPIAHLRRVAVPAWFDRRANHEGWIDGWHPRPGEMVWDHPLPAIFSSLAFVQFAQQTAPPGLVIAGLSLDQAILASVIEGFHRGYEMFCVTDATAGGHPAWSEREAYRRAIFELMRAFCGLLTTEHVVNLLP